MLLTIFVAASNGPSAAESSTTEDQAGERTAATFYEARYLIAGFLLRAGNVCQYQPKRMITAAVRLIITPELKAIAQGFPDTTKKWMTTGTGTFNDGVMTDGLLKACAHAMTVLEEAEQTVRADHSDIHQRANDCIEFEEGQSMTLRGKIVQKATTEPEEGEPPHKYMVIELEDSICFKNAPDIKIDVVALTVAKKWVSRHVVVTGSMEGGLMWSIKVSEIVDEKKVSR
jgi:hypothetical protein